MEAVLPIISKEDRATGGQLGQPGQPGGQGGQGGQPGAGAQAQMPQGVRVLAGFENGGNNGSGNNGVFDLEARRRASGFSKSMTRRRALDESDSTLCLDLYGSSYRSGRGAGGGGGGGEGGKR